MSARKKQFTSAACKPIANGLNPRANAVKVPLNTGDGVTVQRAVSLVQRAVSLTAHQDTELVADDLAPEPQFIPIGDVS